MGRRKVYGHTLLLMVASSFASGFSIGRSRNSVIISLCFFRFWLGIGIGGDYPLSATIMAEYANTNTRGAFMASVYAMHGLGILVAAAVAAIVSAVFIRIYPNPTFNQNDIVWRLILMLGAVPVVLTYLWRMKVPETALYTALVAKNGKQAAADMANVLKIDIPENEDEVLEIRMATPSFGLFSIDFAKLHGLKLIGTASTWFFIDLAFFSNNLILKDMYDTVGWVGHKDKNALEKAFHIARTQFFVALLATMPGYIGTVLLIDRVGRFRIQMAGFLFMAVFIFGLAIPHHKYWLKSPHKEEFVVIYSLTFFFSSFGPNSTAFIVPAELFPARLRSTCHGISGAAGKAGAMIGVFWLFYASQSKNRIHYTLIVLGVASLMGCLFTLLIPETMGRSLEENEVQLPKSGSASSDSERASDSSKDSMA